MPVADHGCYAHSPQPTCILLSKAAPRSASSHVWVAYVGFMLMSSSKALSLSCVVVVVGVHLGGFPELVLRCRGGSVPLGVILCDGLSGPGADLVPVVPEKGGIYGFWEHAVSSGCGHGPVTLHTACYRPHCPSYIFHKMSLPNVAPTICKHETCLGFSPTVPIKPTVLSSGVPRHGHQPYPVSSRASQLSDVILGPHPISQDMA